MRLAWLVFGQVTQLEHADLMAVGTPTDPSVVTCKVALPDGTESSVTPAKVATGKWREQQGAVFSLAGKVKERAVANDLRGRLVEEPFLDVKTIGPDLPDRFHLDIVTAAPSPESADTKATPAKPAAGRAGEGMK